MTRAKEEITKPIKKAGERKNIIKALNVFLSTIRAKKETLEWYIARFERNYAEIERLGETLSPSLLSALLLRHAQLPKDDIQTISVNLESDPKATNAARNYEICKENMRRLQQNEITQENQKRRRRRGTKRKHATNGPTQIVLVTTKVTEIETDPQPLNKLFQMLKKDKKRDKKVVTKRSILNYSDRNIASTCY